MLAIARNIVILFSAGLILLVVGCGISTEDIDATVEAKVKREVANIIDTPNIPEIPTQPEDPYLDDDNSVGSSGKTSTKTEDTVDLSSSNVDVPDGVSSDAQTEESVAKPSTPTPVPATTSTSTPAPTDIQSGLPPPSTETCPQATFSLAEQTNLEWLERPMRSGDAAAIRFSPSDPDILYLGIEVNMHSLYRSEDGGHSWKLLHLFDHAKDIAVHPRDPDIVFLNESGYVWRTDTWTLGAASRLILESSPLGMVLESPYGFGPSETSWSSVVISLSDPNVVYVAMKGGGQDKRQALFRSGNGGMSFDQIDSEFPAINVLSVHPFETNTVLVGSKDGLYRSTDAGRSLVHVSNQRDVVDIDTVDGGLMLAATSAGIVRSVDGGITWSGSGDTLAGHTVLRVQIAPSDQRIVWATTSEGIYRSNDSGRTWNEALGDLPTKNFQALAVHPLDPETVLVSTETFNFSVRSEWLYAPGQYYKQGIYRTDDGGATWQRSDSGIIENQVTLLTAHPNRPYEVWGSAHASRGLYRSRDAGQTWSLSPSLLNHYPMQMAFFPDRPDAFVATGSHTGQNFGVSIDSGVNWFVLSEWDWVDAIRFDKDRFVQKDVRGGNVHIHGVAVDPSNPLIVYAGSIHDSSAFGNIMIIGSHVFKSYDAGVTWEEVGENYPREIETSIRVITVDPHDSNVIYIGTSKQESVVGNGLWISNDAGRTWGGSTDGLPPDASINAIVVHPSNPGWLLVGTQQGMYRSSNAARTWNRVGKWNVWDVETDPQQPDNVYAGTEEGLKFSPDFGKTWKQVSSDQLRGPIIAIAVNCNGTAVYVSDGEHGVKAAFAEPTDSIPLDETKGVEYGKFTSTNLHIDNLGSAGSSDEYFSNRDRDQPGDDERSSGGSQPGDGEIDCMIEALGENAVRQFGPDGRLMSEEEEALVQHCF